MLRCSALIVSLALVALPAFGQKVTIDYADGYEFENLQTFQYVDTEDTNHPSQLMDGRIRDAVIDRLVSGGLDQVEQDPDIYVTYHMAMNDKTVYNTTTYGYGGYGYGWRGYGYGVGMAMPSRTTEHTYTEGTLIVDAYDAESKDMVWHGTGTVTLKDQPSKQEKQIQKILQKMSNRWSKIRAGQAR